MKGWIKAEMNECTDKEKYWIIKWREMEHRMDKWKNESVNNNVNEERINDKGINERIDEWVMEEEDNIPFWILCHCICYYLVLLSKPQCFARASWVAFATAANIKAQTCCLLKDKVIQLAEQ